MIDGEDDLGRVLPCPDVCDKPRRARVPHTEYRYRWPRSESEPARLQGAEGRSTAAVIMLNPSCPDTTESRTFRAIETRLRDDPMRIGYVWALNVLPVRAKGDKLPEVTPDHLPEDRLSVNRRVIQELVSGSDVVVAAWGVSYRAEGGLSDLSLEIYLRELNWLRRFLRDSEKGRVFQYGSNAYHPSRWKPSVLEPWTGKDRPKS